MDEAFLPFSEIVRRTITFRCEFLDEAAGVHSYVCGLQVEMPVELDIGRDDAGRLRIGTVPPPTTGSRSRPLWRRNRMATENTAWVLEDFVDSLVVELDKTRETLAVKAINKPLSYTVKEVALDLNIFPSYDGDEVKFITAQPGQQGASKVTIQLGSITDQQVRATSKVPTGKSDIKIDEIPVDKTTKKKLRKFGITSVDDLKQVARKNVDLKKVADTDIDYTALNNQIQQSRRAQYPPMVRAVSLSRDERDGPCLTIRGRNLGVDPQFQPVAVVNETLATVLSSDANEVRIQLAPEHRVANDNRVILTMDPFAVIKLNVKAKP
jgi:hypothetical protein